MDVFWASVGRVQDVVVAPREGCREGGWRGAAAQCELPRGNLSPPALGEGWMSESDQSAPLSDAASSTAVSRCTVTPRSSSLAYGTCHRGVLDMSRTCHATLLEPRLRDEPTRSSSRSKCDEALSPSLPPACGRPAEVARRGEERLCPVNQGEVDLAGRAPRTGSEQVLRTAVEEGEGRPCPRASCTGWRPARPSSKHWTAQSWAAASSTRAGCRPPPRRKSRR